MERYTKCTRKYKGGTNRRPLIYMVLIMGFFHLPLYLAKSDNYRHTSLQLCFAQHFPIKTDHCHD